MCDMYDKLMLDRRWRVVLRMLDEMFQRAERAHPALPDNIRDIICSGVGRATDVKDWDFDNGEPPGVFMFWYYLPDDIAKKILDKYKRSARGSAVDDVQWAYLLFSPTMNREKFEEWRQRLSKFNSLDEIVEEFVLDRRGGRG